MHNCKRHGRRNCSTCETGTYARLAADDNPLADPLSPLHQSAYGGMFYGSVDATPSSSSCDTNSSSSTDTSSSSSYDTGSSSSSYDSGC